MWAINFWARNLSGPFRIIHQQAISFESKASQEKEKIPSVGLVILRYASQEEECIKESARIDHCTVTDEDANHEVHKFSDHLLVFNTIELVEEPAPVVNRCAQ